MSDTPKPTTWHDVQWKSQPATPGQAKETPGWIKDWDRKFLRQYNPKAYQQQVWLELNPGQELPEELQ